MTLNPVSQSRFFIVFCGYRDFDIEKSIQFLNTFRSLLPRVIIIGAFTNYHFDHREQSYASAFDYMVSSSNESMEFSAYQAGIDFILANFSNVAFEGVYFINDTVWKKNFPLSVNVSYSMFASEHEGSNPVMYGKCDSFGIEKFFVGDLQTRRWISTHLCYFNFSLLKKMNFLIKYDIFESLDNRRDVAAIDKLEEAFFEDVDAYLATKLSFWLFRGGWHNSEPLTPENYMFFRRKLRAILNEMYISAYAQKCGSLVCHRND